MTLGEQVLLVILYLYLGGGLWFFMRGQGESCKSHRCGVPKATLIMVAWVLVLIWSKLLEHHEHQKNEAAGNTQSLPEGAQSR